MKGAQHDSVFERCPDLHLVFTARQWPSIQVLDLAQVWTTGKTRTLHNLTAFTHSVLATRV